MRIFLTFLGLLLATITQNCLGITYSIGPAAGLMQQPTSHYYHYVYGTYAEVSADSRKFYIKALYLERPKFSASGFSDQEFGGFGFVGTKLTSAKKPYAINTLLGGGKISGYIKQDETSSDQSYPTRKYTLNGVALGIEASITISKVHASLFHQTFIGLSSQEDYDANVAWPFNFFVAKVGVYL